MPFHIVPSTNLSLDDLATLHRDGCHVEKTPHVGNMYPNNLAIAAMGIPLLCVDQTIGAKDTNFHPHRVIVNGAAETISDAHKMTSHARITHPSTRVPDRFIPGECVADAHMLAMQQAFPSASLETTSQRARRCVDIMAPFLEVMTGIAPQAWQRIVSPNGDVHTCPPPINWRALQQRGIHGLSQDASGYIIPNAWNILSDGIIGMLTSGNETVYALSGPDMIRYYHRFEADISTWYDAARPYLDTKLPETLTMIMVPVAEMRLVTTKRHAPALDALVDTYLAHVRILSTFGQRLNGLAGEERHACLKMLNRERGLSFERIRRAAHDCPEIFYCIEEANCLTQYDILAGEELYVHPWGMQAPMNDVIKMMNFLRLNRT